MLRIGEIVNARYRIEKVLGEGGMGIVYLSRDSVTERFVALKEIKSSLPDFDRLIERIKKEAKVLAKLNHPNIVILHDLIQFQNNWYLVMEYIEGVTLEKMVEQAGALPHEEAVPIFLQILAALDHAHQAGVIHRDIKPGNVMVKSDGQVKIMDFGLAKIQPGGSITRSTKTEHPGGGTLYYLSPEQVKSEGKVVDHRSDIYSLGMSCYEVLAGYMPLKEKTTTVEILNAILRDNFPPPTKFNAKVPSELSKIIRKAIATEPGKRFQSARAMLEEVEKFAAAFGNTKGMLKAKRRRMRLVLEISWGIISAALVVALITIFAVPDLPLRILRWTGIHSSTKVAVYTEPAGVEIMFGAKAVGKSPLRSRLVDVDTLRVSIQESTYFRMDTSLVVKGATDTTLFFVLQPAAIFAVKVEPELARVMIDGRDMPLDQRREIKLPPGEHELVIAHESYAPVQEKIFLRQGLNPPQLYTLKQVTPAALLPPTRNSQKSPALESTSREAAATAPAASSSVVMPPRTGTLMLAINPPSDVYIGSALAATAVAQLNLALAPGNHTIGAVHATLGRWSETIFLTEQGAAREIDFTQKYAIRILAFDLNGEPLAAGIYTDDQPTQKLTPDKLVLNFGRHEIEVRLPGYEPERREISVEKNDELLFKLKRSQ